MYTAPSSSVCGVSLQANGKEYLITGGSPTPTLGPHPLSSKSDPSRVPLPPPAGRLKADGTLHVTLCDFIELWEATSATQKKSLTQRYEMGCECKVRRRRTRFSPLRDCWGAFTDGFPRFLRSLPAPPSPA